jgi:serine/threonine protein kinase
MIENKIGKYKIIRLIGEGGMASVYEAEHEMLGTKVAIKVLNPILSANAQIKERFRNEAKLMASLDHPNITKVIDFDEQPQQLSIVMEFLNGEDLNDKIKRNGPLTEKEITDVFSQTLSAFQYAHEKGIVHRDIKPSNIFILKNGHVKILDFGIAKLFGQGNEMTQTGTQMGTPIYMSPEQVKADKSIDHRSDIYSLGVTMFYAINGKPPYNSDTDSQFDIFNKIVYEPLPELSGDSSLISILQRACQKDRDNRFQSCQEWLNEMNGKNSSVSPSKHNDAPKLENTKEEKSNAVEPKPIEINNPQNT